MVQGKTDVIVAKQKGKESNCDNGDYENLQPISKQYKNSKAVTVGASFLKEGFGLWVGGLGWGRWVCSIGACCPEPGG